MKLVALHQPDPATVHLLGDLLRQAEAGELQSLIYSATLAGNHVQAGYTPIKNLYDTIGQLERMKALLLRLLDDTRQEIDGG